MTLRLSVIIPTLNEARYLPACLASIRVALPEAEVIVVDGGSRDDTVPIACAHGATVLETEPSRGGQCRLGGERSRGDVLCFLHADTTIGAGAGPLLEQLLADSRNQAATFRVRYLESGWIYRFLEWGCRFDSVWSSLGDQGIVIRRGLYESLGGIPAFPLFEDVCFLQKVRRKTRIRSARIPLTISARRFHHRGVYRQLAHNLFLTLQYLLGTSPHELARRYRARQTDPIERNS